MRRMLYHLLLTFSDKASLFSSKRIERFSIFSTMLTSTLCFLGLNIYNGKLTATELMLIVAGWMAYAGFNVIQGQKK